MNPHLACIFNVLSWSPKVTSRVAKLRNTPLSADLPFDAIAIKHRNSPKRMIASQRLIVDCEEEHLHLQRHRDPFSDNYCVTLLCGIDDLASQPLFSLNLTS